MKKILFENDIINSMEKELAFASKKEGINNLTKAAEYLHSAIEIFEEAGMQKKANQVLQILAKIAASSLTEARQMPSLEDWKSAGVTLKELKEFKHNPIAKAKINLALRQLGYKESELHKLLGSHNVMSEKEANDLCSSERSFGKMWDWMQNPNKLVDPENIQPGEEIEFKSLAENIDEQNAKTKITDRHTSGLTSKKMTTNLKNHGHTMNLSDNSYIDDLLNIDLDDDLEVTEGEDEDKTFEDSD